MKILIATGIYPPEIGGPATYAGLLSEELKRRGEQVIVLPFRDVRKYPKIFRHLIYFLKVVSVSKGVDLIFTQDPVSTGIPVILAKFFTGKKVIMRVAGDYAWEQSVQRYGVKESIDDFQRKSYGGMIEILRNLQKFSVRHADVVVTPSQYFNRVVSAWLGGNKKIITIYNGINLDTHFDRNDKYDDRTIISAGRLVPWKGFDMLITAIKDMPGWRLIIAGDGPDKVRLEALAEELDVASRVELVGQLPRSELLAMIHRSHIFALLSTFESFSFQIVEAMSVGTPVIATHIGNISEIVEDGKSGVLIEPGNIEMFKNTVEKIGADKAFSEMISKEGESRASQFSITRTMDQLYGIFKDLIKSRP